MSKMKIHNGMMIALLFVVVLVMTLSSVKIDIANATAYEDKVYCNDTINNFFEEDKVHVVFDKAVSVVNSNKDSYFTGLGVTTTDLTTISGNISQRKYLNTTSFRQIFELTLQTPEKQRVLDIIDALEQIQGIKWVGTKRIDASNSSTSGSGQGSQDYWGHNGDFGINLSNAWTMSTGSDNVKVGIIDSGISPHVALISNLALGYDFYNNTTNTIDTNGHGTHIAGIIGADGTIGLIGICQNVTMYPLKVKNGYDFFDASATVKAISWAISNDIDILNYSAANGIESQLQKAAINNYMGLFVCAAGNGDGQNIVNDNDATPLYPGNYCTKDYEFGNRVITVGALAQSGGVYIDSNYGHTSVNIFAPGENIRGTGLNNDVIIATGTSFAAPYVTGVATLMLAEDPSLTAVEIKSNILASAMESVHLQDKCTTEGRLEAYRALQRVHIHVYTNHVHYGGHVCDECGYVEENPTVTYTYINLGVTDGHLAVCTSCKQSHTEGHTWLEELGFFKCIYCRVRSNHIEILHPITEYIGGIEYGRIGDIYFKMSDLVLINGKYYLSIEHALSRTDIDIDHEIM